MKKVLFILLIFSNVLFCFGKSTNIIEKLVNEDLTFFQEVIESAYICYDEINERNKIELDKQNMLNLYKKNASWREKKKFIDSFENGINQEALVIPLYSFFQKDNFVDGDLCISTNENNWFPSPKNWYYYSDFYFKKSGNQFYVYNSPNKKLEGQKYTGSYEDLKRTIKNNEIVYIFAPILSGPYTSTNINISKKNYKIPIYENLRFKNSDSLSFIESYNSLYIRASSFNYIEGTENDKVFMKNLSTLNDLLKNKEYIIIDIRGNSGGVEYYPRRLLEKLYNNGDDSKNDTISIFLNKADSGLVELHSNTISKQEYLLSLASNQSEKMIKYYKEQYDFQLEKEAKYYTSKGKIPVSLSQFDLWSIDSRIIVITDNYTASVAEKFIGYLYMLNKNNITIIGENTSGSYTYGGNIKYELPNSKIKITLSSQSYKNTEIPRFIESWHGENYGFYPDYWFVNNNLNEILYYLTSDNVLMELF